MRCVRAVLFLAVIAVAGAGAGLLYALLTAAPSALASTIYGVSIGLTVSSVERGLMLGGLQTRVRRWPSFVYIPVFEAACLALVCLGILIGGTISWSLGLMAVSYAEAVTPQPRVLVYSFLVAALLIFATRVRDLLGRAVFTNLLIGRYHRPVEEERVFLFLDLAGSTAYARRHGDLRAQTYLGAIFAALADPVMDFGGTIDDYVGDMAMITWPLGRGVRDGACVRCLLAILDAIAADRDGWVERFGEVPTFHAALHGGRVVTAEVGVDRHKISYFGDTVNTTARLERLCRELGTPILISGDLMVRLPALPGGVKAPSFGTHRLKGRDIPLEVFALQRPADLAASKPEVVGWFPTALPVAAARG